ncbi:MAG: hypothetical protein WC141_01440 [Arcobacteraceae bacterium]
MSQNIPVRKIPKKHIFVIALTVIIGVAFYFISTTLKEEKLREVLATLGHPNISKITIFKTHKVEDPEVNKKGSLYSLEFTDNDLKQVCRGFILYNYKKEYSKDIECK